MPRWAMGSTWTASKKTSAAIRPDLIGFSVVTNQYKYALEIASAVRG